MKLNLKQFKFETTPQRLKKEILDQMVTLESKAQKTDHDKMFIQMVKAKQKAIKMKLVGEHLPSGTKKIWLLDNDKFEAEFYMNNLVEAIRVDRAAQKRSIRKVSKSFDGSPYEIVGGVFDKSGMINEIGKRTTVNDPMKPKKPRSNKVNYIGVELEFNANIVNEDTRTIAKSLQDAGLSRYVCVGTDGSCGWEVRVLLDEKNFEEPLAKILNILKGKGFTTDSRCGTHVHLDMRNRDVKQCYANLYKSQAFLRKFLDKSRIRNNYCKKNMHADFDSATSQGDRYQSINPQSYRKFQTLEVRMHQGTLEASKLIPWIKLLTKIVNHNSALTKEVKTLKQAVATIQIETPLFESLKERLLAQGAA